VAEGKSDVINSEKQAQVHRHYVSAGASQSSCPQSEFNTVRAVGLNPLDVASELNLFTSLWVGAHNPFSV